MGNLRKLKRNLNEKQVWIAQAVDRKKKELAKAIVKERIEKDAEFAKDVLKAVGNDLPQDFKEAAEKTIAAEEKVNEKCIICDNDEPCSHNFDKMNLELDDIGKRMGTLTMEK